METSDYGAAKWHCLLSFDKVHANSSALGSVFQEDFDASLALNSWTKGLIHAKGHLHSYGIRPTRLSLSHVIKHSCIYLIDFTVFYLFW